MICFEAYGIYNVLLQGFYRVSVATSYVKGMDFALQRGPIVITGPIKGLGLEGFRVQGLGFRDTLNPKP